MGNNNKKIPGIWRLAEECNERALKAEKSLKEIQVGKRLIYCRDLILETCLQDKLEFMGKHHKENDNKNKKQISDLKADNKTKERDLKKCENDLKRATDKVALLEEKVAAIKADHKAKEEETKQEHEKKISNFEERVREFRKTIQSKDDELDTTKSKLQEANETIHIRNAKIEELALNVANLDKDLQKEISENAKTLETLNLKHTNETNKQNKIISDNLELISQKDCKNHELEKNNENLKDELEDCKKEILKLTKEKTNTSEKLEHTAQLLLETKGALQTRYTLN